MVQNPKVAVIVALEREISALRAGQQLQTRYLSGNKLRIYMLNDVAFACAGIGYFAAARAAEAIIQELRPELMVSAGFAGALDSSLGIGSIVVPGKVIAEDSGRSFSTLGNEGVLISAKAVVNADRKKSLRAQYAATAVDMEAAAVAEKADQYNIPFLAIKSISDTVETTLPDLSRFVAANGRFKTAPFMAHLAFHPSLWPSVRRLAVDSAIAAKSLASALREFLWERQFIPLINSKPAHNSR